MLPEPIARLGRPRTGGAARTAPPAVGGALRAQRGVGRCIGLPARAAPESYVRFRLFRATSGRAESHRRSPHRRRASGSCPAFFLRVEIRVLPCFRGQIISVADDLEGDQRRPKTRSICARTCAIFEHDRVVAPGPSAGVGQGACTGTKPSPPASAPRPHLLALRSAALAER